jgi:ribosomal protein L4
MIELPIFNQAGDKVDTIKVDPAKLGGEVRQHLLKQALVMYHAEPAARAASARSPAVKSPARPARCSVRKAPATPAPVESATRSRRAAAMPSRSAPKTGGRRCPKSSAQLARDSALLSKLQSNDVRVVDQIKLDGIKDQAGCPDVQEAGHRSKLSAGAAGPGRDN